MEGRKLAEFKNSILEILLEYTEDVHGKELYKRLEEPLESYEHFVDLIYEIRKNYQKYIKSYTVYSMSQKSGLYLSGTIHTKKFLQDGGFVALYDQDSETAKRMNQSSLQDKRIKDLEEQNLNLKVKTYLVPIGISLVSLGFAIASYFKPSENVSKEVYDIKVESIESQIEQLRVDFKNENDGLKDRLYKAEMLIAIYEDSL